MAVVVGLVRLSGLSGLGELFLVASMMVAGMGVRAAVHSDSPAHTELRLRGRIRVLGSKLISGLMDGLAFGLVGGLISFAASPLTARRASSLAESQRGDRRLTVLLTSMVGVVLVLVFGMLDGLVVGLFGLTGGLLFGLQFGLVTTRACWPAFVLASLWLGARRRLPFDLMAFLDDAYRLGLLRVAGPVYQFRRALHDHLAPPSETTTAATASLSTLRRP